MPFFIFSKLLLPCLKVSGKTTLSDKLKGDYMKEIAQINMVMNLKCPIVAIFVFYDIAKIKSNHMTLKNIIKLCKITNPMNNK